jgi:hypothetical protein
MPNSGAKRLILVVVSELRPEVICYICCMSLKSYVISVLEFRCHLHTLYCMGAIFVYRIRVGLLNQKAFALLGRVFFGVIAVNADIFIG